MNGTKLFSADGGRRWDFHGKEIYKSLITISVEAVKLVALINGGAVVALTRLSWPGLSCQRARWVKPSATLSQSESLDVYVNKPEIEIDNNLVENANWPG